MIKDRPATLLEDSRFNTLPQAPLAARMDALPGLLRLDMETLSGIQPITGPVLRAAPEALRDNPSTGEIAYHREVGSRFQQIFVVMNLFDLAESDEGLIGRPFSISLVPASKRGRVTEVEIGFLEKLDIEKLLRADFAYLGYNPFVGPLGMFGPLKVLLGLKGNKGHIDELGLVTSFFFLTTRFVEDEVALPGIGFNDEALEARHRRFRINRYFRPFKKVQARRIWGAESPIELFMLQALSREGLYPEIQTLIFQDGSAFPSMYHLLTDRKFRRNADLVTEADLYFPREKVAVFCDSNRHHRGKKAREKDARVSLRLKELGITPVRVPGGVIVKDLSAATEMVIDALG